MLHSIYNLIYIIYAIYQWWSGEAHYSKTTFTVRSFHNVTPFASLCHKICTFEVLKILDSLAIPINYMLQQFLKIFHSSFFTRESIYMPQASLKTVYGYYVTKVYLSHMYSHILLFIVKQDLITCSKKSK